MTRASGGNRLLWLFAVLLGIAMLAGPAVPALAAGSSAGSAETVAPTGAVTTTLLAVTPAALHVTDTLQLTVRITNGTGNALTTPRAVLSIDRRSATTRSALDHWADAKPNSRTGTRVADQTVPVVAPGATTDVTFAVSAADLGLTSRSDWGPHGIAVAVSDGAATLDVLRSFVVWAPPSEVTPVGLSFLAAVTGPAMNVQDPVARTAALASATSSNGRLGHVLDATAPVPEVGWVIDPALPALASSATPPVANWGSTLLSATSGRSVFALHPYDPDLAAFAHSPETPLPAALPLTNGAWTTWRTDLAWTGDRVPDQPTALLAATSGAKYLVVGGDAMVGDATYTATGVASVKDTPQPLLGLLADQNLSDLLESSDPQAAPATIARLLAETAMIARERPAERRQLLAALSRTWDPDPGTFAAYIAALRAAPWVQISPIDELINAPEPKVDRAPLPGPTPGPGEITPDQLGELEKARTQIAGFAPITADPALVMARLEPALIAPTAVAYRKLPAERPAAIGRARAATDAVLQSVQVMPNTRLAFPADKGAVQVRVRNSGDQEVRVQVALRPNSAHLQAEEIPTLTIAAQQEADIKIPVRAAGTANVKVDVQLQTVSDPPGLGTDVGVPSSFVVLVRVPWDRLGNIVMTVIIAAIVILGVWRAVRRGRSARRARRPHSGGTPNADVAAGNPTSARQAKSAQGRAPTSLVENASS